VRRLWTSVPAVAALVAGAPSWSPETSAAAERLEDSSAHGGALPAIPGMPEKILSWTEAHVRPV
jgi:hypothetical protein